MLLPAGLAALVVGLAIGSFLTFRAEPAAPLPEVVLPDDAEVRTLRGVADARTDDPDAWRTYGIAATRQAIATADPSWYALAEEALARAEELAPDDPTTDVAAGQLLLSLHDFDAALDVARDATTALPANADAWGVLVDAEVELGRYADAADSLQTMLDLRPDLPALARASYLRQLHGDLDGAVQAMRQAAAAGAGGAGGREVAGLLGELLLHRGDLDGAEEAYLQAGTPDAAAGLARIAIARGDLDRARRITDRVAEQAPTPAVLQVAAEVQQRQGDDDALAGTLEVGRATALLQEAAGQVVDLELALFEASYGDADRAVELARRAHAARPDNVFAAGALAWALHRSGDDAAARDLAAEATRLGTVDTAHELRMAQVLGTGLPDLLQRNPLAEELFLP